MMGDEDKEREGLESGREGARDKLQVTLRIISERVMENLQNFRGKKLSTSDGNESERKQQKIFS